MSVSDVSTVQQNIFKWLLPVRSVYDITIFPRRKMTACVARYLPASPTLIKRYLAKIIVVSVKQKSTTKTKSNSIEKLKES